MCKILAIDTSNYTTSACVFDSLVGVVWERRIPLEVREGECGVRQNDAVFLHTKNLNNLFTDIDVFDIDYVVATNCPSERENSYMPCFLVGMSFGTAISKILQKPFYSYSHQKNHIAAAIYSSASSFVFDKPFIAYHISGGTTDICLCEPSDTERFTVKKIGGTADISCGQLVDRTGVMLGLPFPCGRHIERMAKNHLTGRVRLKNNGGYYNFSGFQNKTEKMLEINEDPADIATYTLDVVYSFILDSVSFFRSKYGNIPVIMSGGVMSNGIISNAVRSSIENIHFSDPYYSVDNAAGAAYLCAHERGCFDD